MKLGGVLARQVIGEEMDPAGDRRAIRLATFHGREKAFAAVHSGSIPARLTSSPIFSRSAAMCFA